MDTSEYVTSGDIARLLGWPLHKVTYALQRFQIVEDTRAGSYRLFRRTRLRTILTTIAKVGQLEAVDGGHTNAN